jgi:hypothetical protein
MQRSKTTDLAGVSGLAPLPRRYGCACDLQKAQEAKHVGNSQTQQPKTQHMKHRTKNTEDIPSKTRYTHRQQQQHTENKQTECE